MPPPPPPSASYLLVLDSDSEEEESPVVREDRRTSSSDHSESSDSVRLTPTSGSRRPHVVEEEDEEEDDDDHDEDGDDDDDVDLSMEEPPLDSTAGSSITSHSKKLTKNQKRKLRRKKKKSKCADNNSQDTTTSAGNAKSVNAPKVTFSDVSIRTYPRAFGVDAVPADGGWPLGMELDNHEDEIPVDLEEFESTKQQTLKDRWKTLLETQRAIPPSPAASPSKSKPSSADTLTAIDPEVVKLMDSLHKVAIKGKGKKKLEESPVVYETRQWDYRSQMKNPLFGVMSEAKRQALFLGDSSGSEAEQQRIKNGSDHSPGTGRVRSDSISSTGCNRSSRQHGHNTRRSRSSSTGNNTNSQNFNDTYTQVYVMHVRNELEELRNNRNKSGATGCNCRKLNVYIPPKDGSAGKKAQHKRMKPSKLSQELKKRNLYDDSMSREDMENTLYRAVEKEPCCRDEDCFCVRNRIDCQTDACSCWHDSHVHVKRYSDSGPLSNDDIEKRCGNPSGMYVVDLNSIHDFRSKVIQHQKDGMLFCLPTSSCESSQ